MRELHFNLIRFSIHRFAHVKRCAAAKTQHEVRAVRVEMKTRNVLHVADVVRAGKLARMAKLSQQSAKMRRIYQSVLSIVTERKFSSL